MADEMSVGTLPAWMRPNEYRGVRPERKYDGSPAYVATVIELLREWNEETVFEILNENVASGQLGEVAVIDCRVYAEGENPEVKAIHETYIGFFGDDDFLFRLIVVANDKTIVLLNDGPIRA